MSRNLLIGIIIAILIIAAGVGYYYASQKKVPTKTMLVEDSLRGVTTWDPSYSYSTECVYLANIYEPLLRIKPDGSIQPVLAKSYKVSSDGLTWTFYLRKNVIFHDGTPFNATAVKFSIERTVRVYYKTGRGAGYIWWAIADNDSNPMDGLSGIEIVSPYIIRIHLTKPVPLDKIAASIYSAWIFSPKVAKLGNDEAIRKWFDAGHDAGTGPYMLKEYVPHDHITLVRFNKYWGGWKPGQFKVIYIRYVPDTATQLEDLKGGSADIITGVPVDAIPDLQQHWKNKIIVSINPSVYNYQMFFNTRKYPFNITLVRQALSYAIPYQDIIKSIGGYARQAVGPVPYGLWPHNDKLFKYTYNLTKAKELLKKAGISLNGSTFILSYAAENPTEARFAPLIKESFGKLGINVKLEPLPWTQEWSQAMSKPTSYDLFLLLWWPAYPDGYDNLQGMFAGWQLKYKWHFNFAWYNNSKFDSLIWQAYTTESTNKTKSFELYSEAQSILIHDAPAAFLFDAYEIIAYNIHIKGFQYNINYPGVIFYYSLTWSS